MLAVNKYVAHSQKVLELAIRHGWRPGARYTNLRDIKNISFRGVGFLDIDWKNYSFEKHLRAAEIAMPFITVAEDVINREDPQRILRQADLLKKYANNVIIVPKDIRLSDEINTEIPDHFILGYSVPTRYGGTRIDPRRFERPVHLLGGRPDAQRKLADLMPVCSIDCNRFTIDAKFGDYFDGQTFRPHPEGGYDNCLTSSLENIDRLWMDYSALAIPERGGQNGRQKSLLN